MAVARAVRVATTRPPPTQTLAQQRARLRAPVVAQPAGPLAEAPSESDAGARGAKRHRPGVDRGRERGAMAAVERVLIPAPDRLARNEVHQRWLRDARPPRGGQVECRERPMRQAPPELRRLQRRGAGAEDARPLRADRLRRGRQANRRRGQAAGVAQLFAWDRAPQPSGSLSSVAQRLRAAQGPPAPGQPRGHGASGRGRLRSPA